MSRKSLGSALTGALLIGGLVLLGPAEGHARLESTAPAGNSQVSPAPRELDLHFNEKVKLVKLELSHAGTQVPVTVDRDAPAAAMVTLHLPALTPGAYEVHWSALTPSDGHVVKGAFSFTVMP